MTSNARSILVFEPHAGSMKRTASLVEQAGYEAIEAATADQATAALEDDEILALLVAHTPAGIEIAHYIREFTPIPVPLAAIVGQTTADPASVVEEMGADGYLRRPFTASTLESFLSVTSQLANLRRRSSELQGSVAELEGKLQRSGLTSARTGFHHFEAVKDLLVLEVRRAKRYGYPLAVLLVGLDPAGAGGEAASSMLPREVTAGLAVAIAKSIRVIDLPIHYADDRILVFLPHTDLAGAEEVGRRIKRRIKRITYRGDGLTVQLTASVGVAAITAGDNLTFSRLIKDAAAALRVAQLKGGDKVVKRTSKNSL